MNKNIIKQIALATILISFCATQTIAQDGFRKGSKTIGIFVGPGFNYGYSYSYGIDGRYVSLPMFGLTYDQGFFEEVGPGTIAIGGVVAYSAAYYRYTAYYNGSYHDYRNTYSNIILGLRGTYHLTLLEKNVPKLDPYAGITLGLRIFRHTDNDPNPEYNSYNPAYPIAGAFVGARYNFTPGFGGFGEVGYDFGFARIGLNFNF